MQNFEIPKPPAYCEITKFRVISHILPCMMQVKYGDFTQFGIKIEFQYY